MPPQSYSVGFQHQYPEVSLPAQFFNNQSGVADNAVAWSSDRPSPLVVQVDAFSNNKPYGYNDNRHPVDLLAQYLTDPQSLAQEGERVGFLKLRYGTATAQNTRYLDVRPGPIQVPPCTFCEVSVRRWNGSSVNPLTVDAINVAVSVAPGVAAPDTPLPRCTVDLGTQGAGTVQTDVIIPPGARYYRLETDQRPTADVVVTAPNSYIDLNVPTQWPAHAAWLPKITAGRDFAVRKTGTGTTGLRLVWEIAV